MGMTKHKDPYDTAIGNQLKGLVEKLDDKNSKLKDTIVKVVDKRDPEEKMMDFINKAKEAGKELRIVVWKSWFEYLDKYCGGQERKEEIHFCAGKGPLMTKDALVRLVNAAMARRYKPEDLQAFRERAELHERANSYVVGGNKDMKYYKTPYTIVAWRGNGNEVLSRNPKEDGYIRIVEIRYTPIK